MEAPKKQVIVPTKAIINCMAGNKEYNGWSRATKKMPAATMVAAWIRAEIGVGPSIASGNQTCKGNWADFAIGPKKTKKQSIKAAHIGNVFSDNDCEIPIAMSLKSKLLVAQNNPKMPNNKPKSPTLLTTKAFWAAWAAPSRSYQKPTNK